jgi:hypothetical protein
MTATRPASRPHNLLSEGEEGTVLLMETVAAEQPSALEQELIRPELDLASRVSALEAAVLSIASEEFSGQEGHPFYGNQWTQGISEDKVAGTERDPSVNPEDRKGYKHDPKRDEEWVGTPPAKKETEEEKRKQYGVARYRAPGAGSGGTPGRSQSKPFNMYDDLKTKDEAVQEFGNPEAEKDLTTRVLELEAAVLAFGRLEFGEGPGHPFRGNQWTEGASDDGGSGGGGSGEHRPIHQISDEITKDWKNVNYAAKPYLEAMRQLGPIDSMYMQDTARDVVQRFLGNSRSWTGDKAREIKAELKAMVADKPRPEPPAPKKEESGNLERVRKEVSDAEHAKIDKTATEKMREGAERRRAYDAALREQGRSGDTPP